MCVRASAKGWASLWSCQSLVLCSDVTTFYPIGGRQLKGMNMGMRMKLYHGVRPGCSAKGRAQSSLQGLAHVRCTKTHTKDHQHGAHQVYSKVNQFYYDHS